MARSTPAQSTETAAPAETAVRYWRLPGGGLLRSQATPPTAAGPPPEGSTEITADEYAAAQAGSDAARQQALTAVVAADHEAIRARYSELCGLGASPDLAAALTGLPPAAGVDGAG